MTLKTWNFLLLIVLFIYLKIAMGAESIIVERYKNWSHPVLEVFKKYSISVYKVSYSQDGKCPTFYTKFRYDPLMGREIDRVYGEVMKANSNFPYTIIIKDDKLLINVGWEDKGKTKIVVDMEDHNSIPTCKMGD